jgi:hypothetical protein
VTKAAWGKQHRQPAQGHPVLKHPMLTVPDFVEGKVQTSVARHRIILWLAHRNPAVDHPAGVASVFQSLYNNTSQTSGAH